MTTEQIVQESVTICEGVGWCQYDTDGIASVIDSVSKEQNLSDEDKKSLIEKVAYFLSYASEV